MQFCMFCCSLFAIRVFNIAWCSFSASIKRNKRDGAAAMGYARRISTAPTSSSCSQQGLAPSLKRRTVRACWHLETFQEVNPWNVTRTTRCSSR